MCLFRKCDETVIETKEYPSFVERAEPQGYTFEVPSRADLRRPVLTTIKCNTCGKIRIDQRDV